MILRKVQFFPLHSVSETCDVCNGGTTKPAMKQKQQERRMLLNTEMSGFT